MKRLGNYTDWRERRRGYIYIDRTTTVRSAPLESFHTHVFPVSRRAVQSPVDTAMTILKQKRRETHKQVAANRTPRPSIKSQQPFDWATVSWGPISEP